MALGILCLAYVLSFIDRQALTMLVEPIKHEFGASDTQMALLQGLAFVLVYSLIGLKVGSLADRINRPLIIVVGILIWSVATVACGLATGFATLFFARIMVGVGEACLNPAAYSLIADYFDSSRRGRAYALFGAAGSIGGGLALLLGGGIIQLIGDTPTIRTPVGDFAIWRVLFVVIGVPGLAMALLASALPEPRRSAAKMQATQARAIQPFRLGPLKPACVAIFSIYSLLQMAGYGTAAWIVSGYVRTFGIPLQDASMIMGAIMLTSTPFGAYVGGWLGDHWVTRGAYGRRLRVVVFGSAIAAPLTVFWWTVSDLSISYVAGWVYYFFISLLLTSGPAVLNDIVPGNLRGRLSAGYMMVTGVIGIAGGPLLIGLATDHLFQSPRGLASALATIPSIALVAAGLIAWRNLKTYDTLFPSKH